MAGPKTYSKKLQIGLADGTVTQSYGILLGEGGRVEWYDESQGEIAELTPGQPVSHMFDFFGGGLGETVDLKRGGYYFSQNCYVGNPWAIRPRPQKNAVTLTGNTTPVTRFFEAWDAASAKYLYCLAGAKSFKIKLSDKALAETKTFAGTAYFAAGTYTGDGGATKAITGVGFLPCAVIVKGAGATGACIRTTDMPATESKLWTASTLITSGVRVLDADGFTVGNNAAVNTNGTLYYWEAWKAATARIKTGTYTGDGTDDRSITGVGLRPRVLHIISPTGWEVVTRSSSTSGDDSYYLGGVGSSPWPNQIQTFEADGFQIGSSAGVNANGIAFYYLAIGSIVGQIATGSYTGDGETRQSITGVGFAPTYIHIRGRSYSLYGVQRNSSLTGDNCQYFYAVANGSDLIESLDADGFTVGSSTHVNLAGVTYEWVAFRPVGTPAVGKPADWIGLQRVPLGKGVEAQTLTTVAVPAATDTWIEIPGCDAQHFQVKDNKLARAHLDRQVSLCAQDNLAIADNWGPDYPVGPPGTVITDIVEWGGELGVATEDGFYMFDGLAVGRQQIPFLGGVSDPDNGKGTIVWGSQILIPTADGLYRWQYGAVAPKGPDTIPGYVDAEGTSSEPIHLQHFGSAFLGDYIYNACKDPSNNYHIIYGRPEGDGFRWDFLLTTTSVIKALHIDSNRCLWFNWGNDVAYIQLRAGGEPSGGNFGEASLSGSIYLPEIIWPTNVRLRMVEVYCRNAATYFSWAVYAYRDGGTAAQVGANFAADGVNKLYWAAASNLTARRLRLRLDWTTTGAFAPDATPPEVIYIRVHGEALPDAAEVYRVAVALDGDGRSPATLYSELLAHENAGVRQIRHIVTDEVISVIMFKHDTVFVKQRGYEEPQMGLQLWFRRGDVS